MNVLFLDIDGTLTPLSSRGIVGTPWVVQASLGTITVNEEIRHKLRELQLRGVTIIWTTLWEEAAEEVAEGLMLEYSGHLPLLIDGIPDFKSRCIENYLKNHPKITKSIWTDDHIEDDEKEYAENAGVKVMSIDPIIGLTVEDLDEIQEYLT